MGAKPWEALETAVQNLKLGRSQLLSQEDKENIAGGLFICLFIYFYVYKGLFLLLGVCWILPCFQLKDNVFILL